MQILIIFLYQVCYCEIFFKGLTKSKDKIFVGEETTSAQDCDGCVFEVLLLAALQIQHSGPGHSQA